MGRGLGERESSESLSRCHNKMGALALAMNFFLFFSPTKHNPKIPSLPPRMGEKMLKPRAMTTPLKTPSWFPTLSSSSSSSSPCSAVLPHRSRGKEKEKNPTPPPPVQNPKDQNFSPYKCRPEQTERITQHNARSATRCKRPLPPPAEHRTRGIPRKPAHLGKSFLRRSTGQMSGAVKEGEVSSGGALLVRSREERIPSPAFHALRKNATW